MSPIIGLILASLVVSIGTAWAFDRGGHDFAVFYHAWKLVLSGYPTQIYSQSPDRFLYAPGFAWLLSPFALFPKGVSLALWCFLKAAVVGWIIREFGRVVGITAAAWATLIIARPLLIDFQYGQVNTLILGACVWALLGHFDRNSPAWLSGLRWAVLSIAAIGKLFPLPLLIVPWVFTSSGITQRQLRSERVGSVLGILLILLIPLTTVNFSGAMHLMVQWKDALVAKGLPMESHNQSFSAFLHHYFSDATTPVISEGSRALSLGLSWLSDRAISLLSIAWSLIWGGFLLGWLVSARSHAPLRWIAVAVGLVIVPLHLVWKPYFVMALPLAIMAVSQALATRKWGVIVLVFVAINLTGFDFTGHFLAARFEAASLFLWMHLLLLVRVAQLRA